MRTTLAFLKGNHKRSNWVEGLRGPDDTEQQRSAGNGREELSADGVVAQR